MLIIFRHSNNVQKINGVIKIRKQKTSKASKNYSRMREMKRDGKKNDVNKTRVSIKFGDIFSLDYEKCTGFWQKTWLVLLQSLKKALTG
ncbi:hypothetical protein [Bacillus tropicus]|uniref:hypothetical protein n=1 Tax=Bacillus tropicus TaxID=2026188 RepID=UPI0011BCF777|nr:hypothetical protein [Bacillus tropicus]